MTAVLYNCTLYTALHLILLLYIVILMVSCSMQPAEQNSGSDATLLLISRVTMVTSNIMRNAGEEWSLSFRVNEEVWVLSKVIARKSSNI